MYDRNAPLHNKDGRIRCGQYVNAPIPFVCCGYVAKFKRKNGSGESAHDYFCGVHARQVFDTEGTLEPFANAKPRKSQRSTEES